MLFCKLRKGWFAALLTTETVMVCLVEPMVLEAVQVYRPLSALMALLMLNTAPRTAVAVRLKVQCVAGAGIPVDTHSSSRLVPENTSTHDYI